MSRALTLAAVAVAAFRAWQMRWVCDDAFISFRYADHLAHGQGLVWNIGERVEGFTNLLWTLFLAVAARFDGELVLVSECLGVMSLVGLAGLLWRFTRETDDSGWAPPLALLVTVFLPDFLTWTTGGLETMSFTALAVALAVLLFGPRLVSRTREWLAGAAGAALFLMRPDGALLAATLASAYLVMRPRFDVATGVRVLSPLATAIALTTLVRVSYYGDWLPNTYYAKSAGAAYVAQGAVYAGLLLARNWVLVLAAAISLVLLGRRLHEIGLRQWRPEASTALTFGVVLYALYVVRSGGDFMFARRLIPVVPLFFMAVEREVSMLPRPGAWLVALGLSAAAAAPYPLYERYGEGGRIALVSDEPSFYPADVVAFRKAQGAALARAFAGIDATFVIKGGLCMLAFYSGLPHIIEPNGLTDRTIAHQSVGERGTPGHEKTIPLWYLEERRVEFVIDRKPFGGAPDFNRVLLDGGAVSLEVLFYDEPVMQALAARPGVTLVGSSALLAQAVRDIDAASCNDARSIVDFLDDFYFRKNSASASRRVVLEEHSAARCR